MKGLIVSSLVADRPFRQRPQAQGSTEGAEGRPAKVGFRQRSVRMVLTPCQTRRTEDATVNSHPLSKSSGAKPSSVGPSTSSKPSSEAIKPSTPAMTSSGVPHPRGLVLPGEESFLSLYQGQFAGWGTADSFSNAAGSSKNGAI